MWIRDMEEGRTDDDKIKWIFIPPKMRSEIFKKLQELKDFLFDEMKWSFELSEEGTHLRKMNIKLNRNPYANRGHRI